MRVKIIGEIRKEIYEVLANLSLVPSPEEIRNNYPSSEHDKLMHNHISENDEALLIYDFVEKINDRILEKVDKEPVTIYGIVKEYSKELGLSEDKKPQHFAMALGESLAGHGADVFFTHLSIKEKKNGDFGVENLKRKFYKEKHNIFVDNSHHEDIYKPLIKVLIDITKTMKSAYYVHPGGLKNNGMSAPPKIHNVLNLLEKYKSVNLRKNLKKKFGEVEVVGNYSIFPRKHREILSRANLILKYAEKVGWGGGLRKYFNEETRNVINGADDEELDDTQKKQFDDLWTGVLKKSKKLRKKYKTSK